MKRLLILTAILGMALFGCKKEEPFDPFSLFDPNGYVTIRAQEQEPNGKAVQYDASEYYTPLEVVQTTIGFTGEFYWVMGQFFDAPKIGSRGMIDEHRDFETPALLWWATEIITAEGEYLRDMTHVQNLCYINADLDTIAYIPNEVIDTARVLIEAAIEAEDYIEVQRIFDEAFKFVPCKRKHPLE